VLERLLPVVRNKQIAQEGMFVRASRRLRWALAKLGTSSQWSGRVFGSAEAVLRMTKLRPSTVYLLLLTVQLTGALFIVLSGLPEFRQLVVHPGEQIPYNPYYDPATIVIVIAMQVAYWYRLRCVPIPSWGSNTLLSHLFLFLGRLTFIFGGSLFAVVFFRHLPEIDQAADTWLMSRRGLQLVASLFALFCVTLELERLGRTLESATSGPT
jgi:hypothetical protein